MSSHKDELLLRSPHDMNAPFQDMSRWNERPMSLAEAFLGTTKNPRTFSSSVSDVSADCSSDVADCGADCQHCALQQQDVSSSLETQAQGVATTTTQDRPGFAPASFEYNDYKLYNGKPAAQSSSSSSSTPLPRSLIRERDDVPRSWHIEHAEFPSLTKLYPEAEPRETSLHHKPSPQQSIKAVVNGHVTTPRSASQSMDSNMKKKLEPRAMKETNDTAARIPARRRRIVWQPPSAAAASGEEDVVPANAQDHHPEQDSSQPTTAGLPPASGGSSFAGWPTYSAADDGWYSEPDPTRSEKYGADDGNDASPSSSSSSSSSSRRGVQLNDNDVLSIRLRLDDDKQ